MAKDKRINNLKNIVDQQPTFIAVDLGTANTIVYVSTHGIIFNEPTILAYATKTGEILYVGKKAYKMIGKTHENITLVRPLEAGVISDLEATQDLLEFVFRKFRISDLWANAIVLIAAPSGVTELEQQALREITYKMGARYVFIEPEAKMAALGAGINIFRPKGSLIVDIGGGTTDIAVVAAGDIVVSDSIKIAGMVFDEEIQKMIRTKYNVMIGLLTAEKIKFSLTSLFTTDQETRIGAYGRDVATGLPKVFGVDPEDVRRSLKEDAIPRVVNAINELLEVTPPELSADIKQSGITLSGGGALFRGIDTYLESIFKLPVTIVSNPLLGVIEGAKLYEKEIIQLVLKDEDKASK